MLESFLIYDTTRTLLEPARGTQKEKVRRYKLQIPTRGTGQKERLMEGLTEGESVMELDGGLNKVKSGPAIS